MVLAMTSHVKKKEHNHKYERKRSSDDLSDDGEEDLANCLVMLSNSGVVNSTGKNINDRRTEPGFECKACKKVFRSHQALGGHRASHKKVKGCFASEGKGIMEDEEEEDDEEEEEEEEKSMAQMARKRSNGHECTICHRVFTSGQALGGHKRCHWLTPPTGNHQPPLFFDNLDKPVAGKSEPSDRPSLDLNLGCPESSINRTDRNEEKNNRFKLSEAMKVQMISSSTTSASSSWLQLASGHWF